MRFKYKCWVILKNVEKLWFTKFFKGELYLTLLSFENHFKMNFILKTPHYLFKNIIANFVFNHWFRGSFAEIFLMSIMIHIFLFQMNSIVLILSILITSYSNFTCVLNCHIFDASNVDVLKCFKCYAPCSILLKPYSLKQFILKGFVIIKKEEIVDSTNWFWW